MDTTSDIHWIYAGHLVGAADFLTAYENNSRISGLTLYLRVRMGGRILGWPQLQITQ